VAVSEKLDAPMGAVLDAEMAAAVADAMRSAGADLRLGTSVSGFAVHETEWSSATASPGAPS